MNAETIRTPEPPVEETIAQAFLACSELTPEQLGMVKLYMAISHQLDEIDAAQIIPAPVIEQRCVDEPLTSDQAPDHMPLARPPAPVCDDARKDPVPSPPAPPPAPAARKSGRQKKPPVSIAPEVARFAEYLASHDISTKRAAADIGYKASFLYRILSGKDAASPRIRQAMTDYIAARENIPADTTDDIDRAVGDILG